MINLTLDTLNVATLEGNYIPRSAITAVYRYLNDRGLMKHVKALAEDWNWDDDTSDWRRWKSDDGVWTKRFSNYVYKTLGVSTETKDIEEIGNILGKLTPREPTTYYYEFTRFMDWVPGNFQENPDSCWWNSKNSSRVGLSKTPEGIAVLFYQSQELWEKYSKKRGIARCFGFNGDAGLAIFNAYGIPLDSMAQIISKNLSLEFQKTTLLSDNGYINRGSLNNEGHDGGDTGLGYILNTRENLPKKDFVNLGDFTMDENCHHCNKRISSERSHKVDGDYWCDDCLKQGTRDKTIRKCSSCGKFTAHIHELYPSSYCETCYNALPECKNHGKTNLRTFNLWHNPGKVCDKCIAEEKACTCEGCGHTVDKYMTVKLPTKTFKLCYVCAKKVGDSV